MWPIIAMIVGTAMQQVASQQSARAVRREEDRMNEVLRQQSLEAERKAMENAAEFDVDKRKENQAEIQEQIRQDIAQPAVDALAQAQVNSVPQGRVSGDYIAAKEASGQRQSDIAQNITRLMASQMGANHLRQREGFRMDDTAMDINRINRLAQSNARIGQERIRNASNKGAGLATLGQLVSLGGSAGAMMGPEGFSKITSLFSGGGGEAAGRILPGSSLSSSLFSSVHRPMTPLV